jgi:enoyl-CoA hydratase/carnithine racemase
MSDCLLSSTCDSTLVLTINRPDKRNALSGEVAQALVSVIAEANTNSAIRSVIIEGAGGKAFSAGADLKERASADAEQKWQLSRRLLDINKAILASPKIFYSSINGWCLGGGLELALACDFRIADHTAVFGWPEVKLGAYPGAGAAVLMPRLIGIQKTKQFLLGAKNINVDEALSIGLIDAVTEPGQATSVCLQRSAQLKAVAPLAQAALKASVYTTTSLSLEDAFAVDGQFRQPLEATQDYQEGIKAFFEKRAPKFMGA